VVGVQDWIDRFLAMHRPKALIGRRLHREQRDNLEQMVLDHVSEAAGSLIERASVLHTEILRQRGLRTGHVVAVPDRGDARLHRSGIMPTTPI
jgi:hypothetical protein